MGRSWHAAGRQLLKSNSIADTLACAEALVARGIANPTRGVALHAFSAGGLTAAAALNRRPELFGAAVLRAPFVDVLTAM